MTKVKKPTEKILELPVVVAERKNKKDEFTHNVRICKCKLGKKKQSEKASVSNK